MLWRLLAAVFWRVFVFRTTFQSFKCAQHLWITQPFVNGLAGTKCWHGKPRCRLGIYFSSTKVTFMIECSAWFGFFWYFWSFFVSFRLEIVFIGVSIERNIHTDDTMLVRLVSACKLHHFLLTERLKLDTSFKGNWCKY